MTRQTSDMLSAIGSAVVASVIVSWTLTTFTLSRIDRELDQIHGRIPHPRMAIDDEAMPAVTIDGIDLDEVPPEPES